LGLAGRIREGAVLAGVSPLPLLAGGRCAGASVPCAAPSVAQRLVAGASEAEPADAGDMPGVSPPADSIVSSPSSLSGISPGSSASGSPVDTLTLNEERLSAGAYRIGFHADLDTSTSEKAYFTYLEISEGPVEAVTRVFRAMHFPHRRREVVSEIDPTPINVQPGEILYDAEENKLYAGLEDTTAVEISGGGGGGGANNYIESDIAGITDAAVVTNIVSISQAAYDALPTKNATTLYIING